MKEYFVVLKNGVSFTVKAGLLKPEGQMNDYPFLTAERKEIAELFLLKAEVAAIIPSDNLLDRSKS